MSTPTADRFARQGHYDQRMAAAWKRNGYLVLDAFVSPNRSASSRCAYAVHYVDGASRDAAENWLQRPDDVPLRGF